MQVPWQSITWQDLSPQPTTHYAPGTDPPHFTNPNLYEFRLLCGLTRKTTGKDRCCHHGGSWIPSCRMSPDIAVASASAFATSGFDAIVTVAAMNNAQTEDKIESCCNLPAPETLIVDLQRRLPEEFRKKVGLMRQLRVVVVRPTMEAEDNTTPCIRWRRQRIIVCGGAVVWRSRGQLRMMISRVRYQGNDNFGAARGGG